MGNVSATLFEDIDAEAEERALEEAERDIREGRLISHEAIRKWLLSWGKPDELPPPKCGE